ncbi:hypothetical protein BP5796_09165 [Coleophoma crateriformis]|uniref:Uncharacterized protein n=1 Tax=Coleophoma crateriformis TaxID=565419 RepID=A0A3D8R3I2_9HELO|nr:hypothetical protein BP5796_09165 [Coleophoma crateriformis]
MASLLNPVITPPMDVLWRSDEHCALMVAEVEVGAIGRIAEPSQYECSGSTPISVFAVASASSKDHVPRADMASPWSSLLDARHGQPFTRLFLTWTSPPTLSTWAASPTSSRQLQNPRGNLWEAEAQ